MPDITEPTAAQLRSDVKTKRRAFAASVPGKFAKAMVAAMEDFRRMRESGVSFEDGVRGIEAVLRDAWPGHTSKFRTCSGCDNTGWRETSCCYGMRCRREYCSSQPPDWEHLYVVECDCTAGEKFRQARRRHAENPEEHLVAVGRRKKAKPAGFTRIGS